MWADAYQPLMSRLVQDSLIKLCSENLPTPKESYLELDAIVCITSGKGIGNQIVVKLHKVIEVAKNNTWHEPMGGDRSGSPWQIPLEKIRSAQQGNSAGKVVLDGDDGPVDLTGSNASRSILQYTSENISPQLVSSGAISSDVSRSSSNNNGRNNKESSHHSELIEHLTGANNNSMYKGPLPVPRAGLENNNSTNNGTVLLNKLSKLKPPNYKPLPHLKLKSPVKHEPGSMNPDLSPATNANYQETDLLSSATPATNEMRCKICAQMCYGGFAALQSHTQEIHRRHLCRFCYNSFSLRCNLKRHERLHVGLKPYNCKICSKSFARSTDLKLHMQKHGLSGSDVVVPCPKCPRSFLSVQNLRWHLYKVHKETEASYACTICEKLFLDKDEYMRHREEHTNGLSISGGGSTGLQASQSIGSANAMMESHDGGGVNADFIEFGPDDSADGDLGDSDNENLYIDTQSEGTVDSACKDDDAVLPNQSHESLVDDLGFELVNEPVCSAPASRESSHTPPPPNMALDGGNISTGSRKRKKGNPTKHVEIPAVTDDIDLDNMYYNSPVAKQRQIKREKEALAESYKHAGSDEPEDLVMRMKPLQSSASNGIPSNSSSTSNTPEDYSMINKVSMPSNTIFRQIADKIMHTTNNTQNYSLLNAIPAQGYLPTTTHQSLGNSWDSSHFKNLKGALTGQSPVPFPGHKTPEPQKTFSHSQSYSPLTLPLMITPDPPKYKPSPKTAIKSTPGEPADLSLLAALDDPNREMQCGEFGCNEMYLGFSAYEDHCMIRHGRYPCKHCKQTFSGKNNRTRHMRCHVGAKVYTCPDCFKNFSRPDSMREHQFIHTLSYQEDKCRNCGSAFDKKNLLLAHLKQCYRHKMETGKSTKLIDETPAYLNNHVNTNNTGGELDFKPLQPMDFKLDSLSAINNQVSMGANGRKGTPPLSSIAHATSFMKGILPAISPVTSRSFTSRSSPTFLNYKVGNVMSPIVIAPQLDASIPMSYAQSMSPIPFTVPSVNQQRQQQQRAMSMSPIPLTVSAMQQQQPRAMSMSPTALSIPPPSIHQYQQRHAMSASPVSMLSSVSQSIYPVPLATTENAQSESSLSPIPLVISSEPTSERNSPSTDIIAENLSSNSYARYSPDVQKAAVTPPISNWTISASSSLSLSLINATATAETSTTNSADYANSIDNSNTVIDAVKNLVKSTPSSGDIIAENLSSYNDARYSPDVHKTAVAPPTISPSSSLSSSPINASATAETTTTTRNAADDANSIDNTVIDAVKNLVKSRASPLPLITDQNANKTPGVESSE